MAMVAMQNFKIPFYISEHSLYKTICLSKIVPVGPVVLFRQIKLVQSFGTDYVC